MERIVTMTCLSVRRWWNWQTRRSQKPMPKGVRVQLPPSAFFLESMKRAALAGMLIGGLGGPLLLACLSALAPYARTEGQSSVLAYLLFFLLVVGPFGVVVGGGLGWFAWRWRERGVTSMRTLLYSVITGAFLGVFALWAAVGFLYSFGAIAGRLGIVGWLAAFWPIVLGLMPQALMIGMACGMLIGLVVWKQRA